ncbi:7SK snRNA methylphosphate capping enzyme [Portunus trituberculatus]|uniref:RNA methyltransferase n=1 Tax=Portunus trituberculatus TaxID=210409 RepID=A0A5B7DZ96_PORTR|nr:7SK snRNA methylphosphate capping enzyme [Portunus trituberculatus]
MTAAPPRAPHDWLRRKEGIGGLKILLHGTVDRSRVREFRSSGTGCRGVRGVSLRSAECGWMTVQCGALAAAVLLVQISTSSTSPTPSNTSEAYSTYSIHVQIRPLYSVSSWGQGDSDRMSSELGVERPTTLSLSEAQGVERRVHFDEVERPRLVTARQHSTPSTSSPRYLPYSPGPLLTILLRIILEIKRKRRLSEPVDGHVGQEGEEVVGLEEVQEGGSSPSRPDQVTLKPLTINTDLVSPPGTTEGRRESSGGQPVTPTGTKPGGPSSAMQRPPFKKQRHKSDNKIVSPVIPQPGGERKRHPSHPRHHTERPHLSQQNLQPPRSYNPKSELFQFGNYNKYYGYRNPDQTPDVRLEYLKREWFDGREVLDIGCNIGHVTLTVARDFNPKRVVGIDIDKKLVNIAQKNIKHYLRKGDAEEANFPKSMRLLYGPLRPPVQADGFRSFPHNVKFVHGNYVLESDELLETVRPEFDLVLCLSITKWIHLNWGDAGLKRFFRRIFYNLRPGGRLVLEPQAWPSYNKRRKLTNSTSYYVNTAFLSSTLTVEDLPGTLDTAQLPRRTPGKGGERYLLFQSPPARKLLPRVRKPNRHSDRGQDLNPCAWRPLGPQSTHGSTVPLQVKVKPSACV